MSKVILRTLDNLENQPTALAVINQNFTVLQNVVDTLVSRDGAVPNTMLAILDMNGHKIINLPVPTTPTEPARHGDIQQYVDQAHEYADEAAASAVDAQESEDQTLVYYTDFLSRYIGSYDGAPTLDALGNPLKEGALYWDTFIDALYVWAVRNVYVDTDQVLVGTDIVQVSTWDVLPAQTLRSLSDVDIIGITNGQFLQWNSGDEHWHPFTLNASTVSRTATTLTSTNVQAALAEIVSRVVLDQYDIEFYLEGLMNEAENLYRMGVLRAFTIPSNTTGFIATAGTAATGSTVLTLKKNGTQFGTVTFAASGTVGTWSIPGDTSFVAGDTLVLQAPNIVDTSLSDVTIGIIARR